MTSPEYQAPTWVNEDDPAFIEGVSPDLGAGYLNQLSGAVEDHGQRLGAIAPVVTYLNANAVTQDAGDNRYILQDNANGFAPAEATANALAGKQPLDADLTAIAGLDSTTAGTVASDGAGWVKKTYAQLRTALGLATIATSGKLADAIDLTTAGTAVGTVVTALQADGAAAGYRWPTPAQHPALGRLLAGLVKRTTTPCRIAFAGSSTTAGSNASTPSNRYVDRLVAMIQAAFPSGLGAESSVVASTTATWGTLTTAAGVHGYNAGDGSTNSSTYLDSTEIASIASLAPAAVFHMIGTNDYGSSTPIPVATYKANVQAKLAELKAAITSPCVHVLIHTYPRTPGATPLAAWAEYGRALDEIAAADPDNAVAVDISRPYALLGWPGADPLDLIDTDSIHQTDAGHALMAELIARAIGVPGPRTASTSSGTARTLGRITSSGPDVDAADLVGTSTDISRGGAAKTFAGTATSLAASGGKFVRGSAPASAWFVGVAEPVADVETSYVIDALPTGASVILDVHRSSSSTAGTPDAYRAVAATGGTVSVQKRVAGVSTTIITARSYAAGDRIGLRYYRGAVSLLINGVVVAAVTDNSLPAKGFTGFAGTSTITAMSCSGLVVDAVT